MRLRRLSVEEGFLNGLSLAFVPGLNVLIGPRGVGKTSVIELVRFCLAIPAYTTENDRRAREHALSVLRGGRVTLEIEHEGNEYKVTRTPDDELNSLPSLGARPIILAQ